MELIVKDFSSLNLKHNEKYLHRDFNINLFQSKNYNLNVKRMAVF